MLMRSESIRGWGGRFTREGCEPNCEPGGLGWDDVSPPDELAGGEWSGVAGPGVGIGPAVSCSSSQVMKL